MNSPRRLSGLNEVVSAFRASMTSAGVVTSDPVIADGKLRRVHVKGDRRGSRHGWYVLHSGEIPAGAYGSWRLGVSETWREDASDRFAATAEPISYLRRMADARRRRELETANLHRRAAERAEHLWSRSHAANLEHPYLKSHRVAPHGIRQLGARLVIPVRNAEGTLGGLQFIDPTGVKRYLAGTPKRGRYFTIGSNVTDVTDKSRVGRGHMVVIAEGFATAATLHEATGLLIACAFDAGNLQPVAEQLRHKLPHALIVLAADNDRWTPGNPGIAAARAAASAVRGSVVVPTFGETESGSDWNDVARARGCEAVRLVFQDLEQHAADVDYRPRSPLHMPASRPRSPLRVPASKPKSPLGADGARR